MNPENKLFTMARLGRHWSPDAAARCLAFFGSPYRFDWKREIEFRATHATDYEPSGYNLRDRIRHAEYEAHGIKLIYDNGGKTADRYTIYLPELHNHSDDRLFTCLGLSENPDSPQGFSQFSCGHLGLHNGDPVFLSDLPENVRRHALARIAPQQAAA